MTFVGSAVIVIDDMLDSSLLYKIIGQRVRLARLNIHLTQATLAKIISLSRTSITNIEKGRQKMLVDTLCNLASALGIPAGELLPENIATGPDTIENKLPEGLSKREIGWIKSVAGGGGEHGNSKKGD